MTLNTPSIIIDRLPAVTAKCGQSRSSIYKAISEGVWPRPIRLGVRCVGWLAHETDAVLRARVAGRSADEIRKLVKQLEAARNGTGGEVS